MSLRQAAHQLVPELLAVPFGATSLSRGRVGETRSDALSAAATTPATAMKRGTRTWACSLCRYGLIGEPGITQAQTAAATTPDATAATGKSHLPVFCCFPSQTSRR